MIRCHFISLFFLKSGTLIFGFFGITISNAGTFCLRRAFALASLFLHSRSALMTDAEGHHRGGRAELEHLTRRDGVLYNPFERIRMKGIASIRVDGMVLHQSLHRVGQKGA